MKPNPSALLWVGSSPKQNICIEFDGEQHFRPINYFGGITNFDEIKKRDNIKDDFCKKNGIKLIRVNKENVGELSNFLI